MSGRNDNAFDRQLDREIDRLAGPEPRFDVREVVEQASGRGSRRHSFFGGSLLVPAALAVVTVFGLTVVFFGLLQGDDEGTVGASPSASPVITPVASTPALPLAEVTEATGTMRELFVSFLTQDIEGTESALHGPRWFEISATDPRLEGEATLVTTTSGWGWGDDEETEPGVDLEYGRLEIKNDRGTWSGTVGPNARGAGSDHDDLFERLGAVVLTGTGEYAGSSAVLALTYEPPPWVEEEGEEFGWIATPGFSGPFRAIIVNREPIGFPTDEQWLEQLRRTGQAE